MSGNQQIELPPAGGGFPVIGDYDWIPGPGDVGYVEPEDIVDDDDPDLEDGDPDDDGDDVIEDETEVD